MISLQHLFHTDYTTPMTHKQTTQRLPHRAASFPRNLRALGFGFACGTLAYSLNSCINVNFDIEERQHTSITRAMINAVLVFNNAGQPRLTKFYTQLVSHIKLGEL